MDHGSQSLKVLSQISNIILSMNIIRVLINADSHSPPFFAYFPIIFSFIIPSITVLQSLCDKCKHLLFFYVHVFSTMLSTQIVTEKNKEVNKGKQCHVTFRFPTSSLSAIIQGSYLYPLWHKEYLIVYIFGEHSLEKEKNNNKVSIP